MKKKKFQYIEDCVFLFVSEVCIYVCVYEVQ